MKGYPAFLNITANIASIAAPALFLILMVPVSALKLPEELGKGLFYTPFALIFVVLAFYRLRAGGILLIIDGGLLFSASLITHRYSQYYLTVRTFSVTGGILHIIRAHISIPD